MSLDDLYLKKLFDFSDLNPKKETFSMAETMIDTKICTPESQLSSQINDKVLKSFKELREKLRETTQQNTHLRQKQKDHQSELQRYQLSERDIMIRYQEAKAKSEKQAQELDEFKKKVTLLKEANSKQKELQNQLAFIKLNCVQQQETINQLTKEKNKLMEISIEEKIDLEEKIRRAQAKQQSDSTYTQNMEAELSKYKDLCLKIENEFKKLQIKYDEELYSKKWMNQNFEKVHLEQENKQLNEEKAELNNKVKKEKERRTVLEKRVLELEEMTGLWNVKAETYQGEAKMMNKKVKKIERRISQAKINAEKAQNEKLNWEEKFLKAVAISDELISRVKRQLMGDMVTLAKSCDHRITKLKQDTNSSSNFREGVKRSLSTDKKSSQIKRSGIKEVSSSQFAQMLFKPTMPEFAEENLFKSQQFNSNVLGDTVNLNKRYAKNEPKKENKGEFVSFNSSSNFDKGEAGQHSGMAKENNENIESVESKVRKERQEMEKKLREKNLYRKLDVANSPQKHSLRADYFKIIGS